MKNKDMWIILTIMLVVFGCGIVIGNQLELKENRNTKWIKEKLNVEVIKEESIAMSFNKNTNNYEKINFSNYSFNEMIKVCEELNYSIDKIYCVNDFVISHYNYSRKRPSDDMDDIVANGTNCVGYSNLYLEAFSRLKGVKYESFRIEQMNGSLPHRLGYVYTDYDICLIDQKALYCRSWN